MNDSFKMFVIALVTAVATQLLLAPYILKLQGFEPAGTHASAATQEPAAAPTPPATAAAKLTAPNLEGLSVDAARERWRAKDITIIEDGTRADSGAKAGTILSQRPAPGEALDSKEIRVTIAQAGESIQVPDVMGQVLADARTELVDAGFEVPEPKSKKVDDVAKDGKVIAMEPNAGAQASKGVAVRLTIGKAEVVAVPDFTGSYLKKARVAIEEAGFKVGKIRRVEHPERGQGYVLKQDPEAGATAQPGSEIELVVVAPN